MSSSTPAPSSLPDEILAALQNMGSRRAVSIRRNARSARPLKIRITPCVTQFRELQGNPRTPWTGEATTCCRPGLPKRPIAPSTCPFGRRAGMAFKLSTDPSFESKLRDVVGLYVNPPAAAAVFCFDEKTQVQALDRTQPSLPMVPGRAGTMTHDCKRNGTLDLFAALNVGSGQVLHDTRRSHTGRDVRAFSHWIDKPDPFVWTKPADEILDKVARGQATLDRITKSATH